MFHMVIIVKPHNRRCNEKVHVGDVVRQLTFSWFDWSDLNVCCCWPLLLMSCGLKEERLPCKIFGVTITSPVCVYSPQSRQRKRKLQKDRYFSGFNILCFALCVIRQLCQGISWPAIKITIKACWRVLGMLLHMWTSSIKSLWLQRKLHVMW